MRIETPALQAMIARLVIALLIVGAFVSLGMWASSTTVWDWMATVATSAAALMLSGALRTLALPADGESKFARVVDVLRETPIVQRALTDQLYRGGIALAFGISLATAETWANAALLADSGLPPFARALIALAIVSVIAWTAVGLLTQRYAPHAGSDAPFGVKLADALGLELREVPPFGSALIAALGRTALTVAIRSLLVIVLPAIFESQWAIAFVAIAAVTAITAGDYLAGLLGAARGTAPKAAETAAKDHAPGVGQ